MHESFTLPAAGPTDKSENDLAGSGFIPRMLPAANPTNKPQNGLVASRPKPLPPPATTPVCLGVGKVFRGWARVESGEGEAGIAEMQQAMVELAGIGSGIGAPASSACSPKGLRKVGRHDEALGALGLGVAQAEQQGQHYYDAELHRLRAEILLDMDGNAVEEAEALFGQSLEIARRQEAKTFELRAATSLARLWQRQGKRDAGPRPPRPGLRLVHRRLRHARSEGREGAARRAEVVRSSSPVFCRFVRDRVSSVSWAARLLLSGPKGTSPSACFATLRRPEIRQGEVFRAPHARSAQSEGASCPAGR